MLAEWEPRRPDAASRPSPAWQGCRTLGNRGPYLHPGSVIKVLRRAVELGVTLIDTAHAYWLGFDETLIAETLYLCPKDPVITTQCGVATVGPGTIGRRHPHHLGGEPEAAPP